MNKNKLIAAIMAGTMVMGSSLPVFAATVEEDPPFSLEELEGSGARRKADVYYEQSSTFSVLIPKTIVLDASKSANYPLNVIGDVAADKQVAIRPVDTVNNVEGINFYMVDQAVSANKKADIVATITQNDTVWLSEEMSKEDGTTK